MKYDYLYHFPIKKHDFMNYQKISANLFNVNQLGTEIIIKQILQDFGNNDKLGFIFPVDFISGI